jgi:ABC-type polysaccharide/polyol phosphate export permease
MGPPKGFFEFLIALTVQIVFVILKLTGQIDWSWFWVLLPFVLPITMLMLLGILCFLSMLVTYGFCKIFKIKNSYLDEDEFFKHL